MGSLPGTPQVNPFIIPQPTPRTEMSNKNNVTPQKFKSPGSTIRDLTQSFDSMNASMTSPPKESPNASVNPQSQNNSKGRK